MNDKECISLAKHAIGMDNKKVYTRHNKRFYKPYRNYFSVAIGSKDYKIWLELENAGYAKAMKTSISTYGKVFYLTREGLNWLGEKLDTYIYDEVN